MSNTGTARLSGQINGALTNTGSLVFTGPITGITALATTGPLDLGGGGYTVAALSGSASAVLGNGRLTVGGPASSTYAGTILDGTSPTSLTKVGTGTLNLTGTGRFSGPTTVQAGTLSLNGFWTSPITVAAAGTLRGTGTVAAPIVVAGALRPGNSPGTLTVAGPVSFAPGSVLGIDIDGLGTQWRPHVQPVHRAGPGAERLIRGEHTRGVTTPTLIRRDRGRRAAGVARVDRDRPMPGLVNLVDDDPLLAGELVEQ